MTSLTTFGGFNTAMAYSVSVPAVNGRCVVGILNTVSRQTLPEDPVGTTTVTFSGVNANSEIRVYLPDATEVAGIETCAADQALTWPVYSGGSANNTVRVVVIHPDYKIKEFNYTVSLGNQTLPIQQERDKWYSNPA